MTTAADILAAIRRKHRGDAVVREVVIDDPLEAAISRRDQVELRRSWGPGHAEHLEASFASRGLPVADSVPEGWTFRQSVARRRIDALIFASAGITAVEIKVTRADFRRDTEDKRRAWRSVTNRFLYATPAGLIQPTEVPDGCGLIEFAPDAVGRYPHQHGLTTIVRAQVNKNPDPLPRQVLVALAYRVSKQEAAAA